MRGADGTGQRPDPAFEAFAEREPYFAVLTAPKFLRANLTPETEHEFFGSGETQVDATFTTIELRLAPHFAPTAILEYGCGAGRLALPLARHAARRAGLVTAVDRSPAMLRAAEHEAGRRGITNITFLTPEALFSGNQTFDFVNCYLVFQRTAPGEGVALLRQLVSRIRPGGIGVFHFPYRTDASRAVRSARWLRANVPGANAVANLIRRKPPADPFIDIRTYDLDQVLRVLDDASLRAAHIVFEHHAELSSAIVFAEVPMPLEAEAAAAPATIDVRTLVASTSIDELNRAAENYFASLTDWDHHLAKPFSSAEEAPLLLTDVATMLQGLRLTAGATVLEFGAGTGWLSRFLTQLGCRVILLDVSPTALRMAEALYERLPVIGDRPRPQFLLFDGRRIDLPNATVDRVVGLHALHHTPNPETVIGELGRILKPGGIAGFAEPGPRHSRSSLSQFEMRTYAVVENDIDVHALWDTARRSGFADIKLAIFNGLPFHVSLQEYEDFLAGGEACASWAASTRVFLRNVRSFFLFKEGSAREDSRSAVGLECQIHAQAVHDQVLQGQTIAIDATVTNSGTAVWLASNVATGGVTLGAHLYDASGLVTFDVQREPLADPPRDIQPGESVQRRIRLPPQQPGRYVVELDCVASGVNWFAQLGSRPERVPVDVA
jgi:SAM-dependent methyltransferase